MKYYICLIIMAISVFSCKQSVQDTPAKTTTEVKETPPTPPNITLSPADSSAVFADAEIVRYSYKKGKFDFKLAGKSYQLGQQTGDATQKRCANSAEGQHIHLIIDDQPYAAKYTASFDHEIADGEHHLLAFLSRSYHEGIKTPKAFKAQKIVVKDGSLQKSEDTKNAMLFYSRPKGTYVAEDTKRVLLDFYLANVTLGNDFKVAAKVNNQEFTIDKWQPYYLENLPMGENTITLTLLDKEGKPVVAPFNPITRTITLMAEKPAEPVK